MSIGTKAHGNRAPVKLRKRVSGRLWLMSLEDHLAPTSLYDSLLPATLTYQAARTTAIDAFNDAIDASTPGYRGSLLGLADARNGTVSSGALTYDAGLTAADEGMATALESAAQAALSAYGPDPFDVTRSNDSSEALAGAAQSEAYALGNSAAAINDQRHGMQAGAAATYAGQKSSLNNTWDGAYSGASGAFNSSVTAAESAYTGAESAATQIFNSSTQSALNSYRSTMQGADQTLNTAIQNYYRDVQAHMMWAQQNGQQPDQAYLQSLLNTLNQAKKDYALRAADANITWVGSSGAAYNGYVTTANSAGRTKAGSLATARWTWENTVVTADKGYGDGAFGATDGYSDTAIGTATNSRVSLGNAVVGFNNTVNGLLAGNLGENPDPVLAQVQDATTAWAGGYFGAWSSFNQTVQAADQTNITSAWDSLQGYLDQWTGSGATKTTTIAGAQQTKTNTSAQVTAEWTAARAADQKAAAEAQAQNVRTDFVSQPPDFFANLQPGSYSQMPLTPAWMPGYNRPSYQSLLENALFESNGLLSRSGWVGEIDLGVITFDEPLIGNTLKRAYTQWAAQARESARKFHLTDSFTRDVRGITLLPWEGPQGVPGANPTASQVLGGFLSQLPKAALETYPNDLPPLLQALKQTGINMAQKAWSDDTWEAAFGDLGQYVKWPVAGLGVATLLGADYVLPNHPLLNLGNKISSKLTYPADPSDPTQLRREFEFGAQFNFGRTANWLLDDGFQWSELPGHMPILNFSYTRTWRSFDGVPRTLKMGGKLNLAPLFQDPAPPAPAKLFEFNAGFSW